MTTEYMSAAELVEAQHRGEVSAVELTKLALQRIDELNPKLNAVVVRDDASALANATKADEARKRGDSCGALHGVPITVKDSLETKGLVTTAGATELRNHVPTANAVAVQRMLDAGAVLIGKTNLPRYASDWQSFNDVYGRTNNPWDVDRTVGGSSGGAAASIAAGFVPLEIGSDIAGSIRTPAHYCGVFGHKPSYGLVPVQGHIPGPPGMLSAPDLAVVGPLARSAKDLSLALDILAGPDELSSPGWNLTLPDCKIDSAKKFRVGYWFDDPLCPIDSEVENQLRETLDSLSPHVELVEVKLPFTLSDLVAVYAPLLLCLTADELPGPVRHLARLMSSVSSLSELVGRPANKVVQEGASGLALSHSAWLELNERRTALRWACKSVFQDIDVLLSPVVPTVAPPHQTKGSQLSRSLTVNGAKRPYTDHIPWISLATVAYLPATSVPIGLSSGGLPVNIQVIGNYLADRTTLRFAELLESIRGGFRRPPQQSDSPGN